MSKARICAVICGVALVLVSGCASGGVVNGDHKRIQGVWFGDLGIDGHFNNVRVESDSRLRKLSVIGDKNNVLVEDEATIGKIEVFGTDNLISIPEGLETRTAIVGKLNRVVTRPPMRLAPSATADTTNP